MTLFTRSLLLTSTLFLFPIAIPSLKAAPNQSLADEYEQVRKIAQRDPKVREAYERADQRLEDKIVELDPALRGYSKHSRTPAAPAAAAPTPVAPSTHTAPPAPRPPAATPAPQRATPKAPAPPKPAARKTKASTGRTHVVAAGETLGVIASRYHVSTSALESANHLQDENKLRVGQTLVIPAGSAAAAPHHRATTAPSRHSAPAAQQPKPVDPPSEGIWDKLKKTW